jgi:hypothetical protein
MMDMLEMIKLAKKNQPSSMDMIFSMVTIIAQNSEIPIQFRPKIIAGNVLTIVGPDGKLDQRFQIKVYNNTVMANFFFQNFTCDICNPKELDELEARIKQNLSIMSIQGPNN